MNPGDIIKLTFRVYPQKAGTLAPTLDAGNYRGNQTLELTLTDADPAADIFYTVTRTTDGTEPADPAEPTQDITSTDSTAYTAAGIPLNAPAPLESDLPNIFIVKARAFAAGKVPSDILRIRCEIRAPKVDPVVIEDEPGNTFGSTLLKLSSPTPGVEIRYELADDGTTPRDPVQGDPSAGGSPIYNPAAPPSIKPDALNQLKTFRIKARAFKTGFLPSDVSPAKSFPLKVTVKQISVGSNGSHSRGLSTLFLLLEDGSLWGVGDNRYGQLGNGNPTLTSSPMVTTFTRVMEGAGKPLTNAKEVTGSWKFTAVLKNDGTVYTFGNNASGQLGHGDTTNRKFAAKVSGQSGIVSIAAGTDHLILVNENGRAVAAGRNQAGQLAPSSSVVTSSPSFASMTEKEDSFRPPKAITNIARAFAGHDHSLLLTRNDKVWAAGKNDKGQLGVGSQTNQNYLKPVNPVSGGGVLSDVVDIAGFDDTSLFILKGGRLVGTGSNSEYQLGLIKTIRSYVSTPVQLGVYSGTNRIDETLDTGISNAAGLPRGGTQMADFTFYVDTEGLVHATGYVFRGQFTDGILQVALRDRFYEAPNIQNVQSAVTAAGPYMMFLLTDGSLKVSNPSQLILSEYIEGSGPVRNFNPLK